MIPGKISRKEKKFNLRKISRFKQSNSNWKADLNFSSHQNHEPANLSSNNRFRVSKDLRNFVGNSNLRNIQCLACGKSWHAWSKWWDHTKKDYFIQRYPNIVAGCDKINTWINMIYLHNGKESNKGKESTLGS